MKHKMAKWFLIDKASGKRLAIYGKVHHINACEIAFCHEETFDTVNYYDPRIFDIALGY